MKQKKASNASNAAIVTASQESHTDGLKIACPSEIPSNSISNGSYLNVKANIPKNSSMQNLCGFVNVNPIVQFLSLPVINTQIGMKCLMKNNVCINVDFNTNLFQNLCLLYSQLNKNQQYLNYMNGVLAKKMNI